MLGARTHIVQQLPLLISSELPIQVLLERTLKVAHLWLGSDCAVLTGSTFIGIGVRYEEWHSPRYKFARHVIDHVIATRAGYLTSDAQPYEHHDIARTIGLHSIVCVPLLRAHDVLGALYLQRRLTAAVYTPDDLDLLETIACHVATTLP